MTSFTDGWLGAILYLAATWRITHLFMYEAGPFKIVLKFRELTGVRHDEYDRPSLYPDGNVFECFLCLSLWVALILVPFALFAWPVIAVLAMSAGAIWVEKWYSGKGRN